MTLFLSTFRAALLPVILCFLSALPAVAKGDGQKDKKEIDIDGKASFVLDEGSGYSDFPYGAELEIGLKADLLKRFRLSGALENHGDAVELKSFSLRWDQFRYAEISAGFGKPDTASVDAWSEFDALSCRETRLDDYLADRGFREKGNLVGLSRSAGTKGLPISYSLQYSFDGTQYTPESSARFTWNWGGRETGLAAWGAWAPKWLEDTAGEHAFFTGAFGGIQGWDHEGTFRWEAAFAGGKALDPWPEEGTTYLVPDEPAFFGGSAFFGTSVSRGSLELQPSIGTSFIAPDALETSLFRLECLCACSLTWDSFAQFRLEGGLRSRSKDGETTERKAVCTGSAVFRF